MFVDGTYIVTVNYDQSLADMITAGKYDYWMIGDINEMSFPIQKKGTGTSETVITLFHFNKWMSTDAVLAELDKHGFRAATLPELLALGAYQPELQRQYLIVALGSVCRILGYRNVARLDILAGSLRSLQLDWNAGGGRDSVYRYAAVRKVA